MLVIGFTSKFFPIHIEILEFFNVALIGRLCFSQFREKRWKFFFYHKPMLYFQIVSNSLNCWEGQFFRHGMIVGEKERNQI